jgi:hypothetical protein
MVKIAAVGSLTSVTEISKQFHRSKQKLYFFFQQDIKNAGKLSPNKQKVHILNIIDLPKIIHLLTQSL